MRQFAQLLSLHSCSLLQASTAYRCYSVPTAKRLRLLLLGQARELGGLYLLALALLALLPLSLGQLRLLERLEPSQLLCRDLNLKPLQMKVLVPGLPLPFRPGSVERADPFGWRC